MSITFTNVKARMITELQEAASPVHWTTNEFIRAANGALECFQIDTQQIQTNKVYHLVPNTNQYTYPTNALMVLSAWYDDDNNEVSIVDTPEKVQAAAGAESGDPEWLLDADVPDKFMLKGKGVTNDHLKLIYIKALSYTTNGSSVGLRGTESGISAIVFKALSILWRREGKTRNPERSALYDSLYQVEAFKRQNRSMVVKRHSIIPGGKATDKIKADYGNTL